MIPLLAKSNLVSLSLKTFFYKFFFFRKDEASGLLELINFCLMDRASLETFLEDHELFLWLPQLQTLLQERFASSGSGTYRTYLVYRLLGFSNVEESFNPDTESPCLFGKIHDFCDRYQLMIFFKFFSFSYWNKDQFTPMVQNIFLIVIFFLCPSQCCLPQPCSPPAGGILGATTRKGGTTHYIFFILN